jgi:hypothetical protein
MPKDHRGHGKGGEVETQKEADAEYATFHFQSSTDGTVENNCN